MKFVKMHGCGNDYVYLDGVRDAAVRGRVGGDGWVEVVQRMSDRHRGVGSDGVIVLCPPTEVGHSAGAAVRMRMFNADGSEAEMCGNGVRCVAKFAHDRLGVAADGMRVETGRGVLEIACRVEAGRVVEATVDMGAPILELDRVPVDERELTRGPGGYVINGAEEWEGWGGWGDWAFVSMGNPHAVTWSGPGDLRERERLAREAGPRVERMGAFPRRTNVHFARALDRTRADVVTWERGAGITRACGTGACAVLVAGVLSGRLEPEATIRVLGGELRIRWDVGKGRVLMTGEAVDVFEGTWGA